MHKKYEIKYIRDWSLNLYSELERIKNDLLKITKRLDKLEGNKK